MSVRSVIVQRANDPKHTANTAEELREQSKELKQVPQLEMAVITSLCTYLFHLKDADKNK